MDIQDLTKEQIENMRLIVNEFDKKNRRGKITTFDINNPERTPGFIPKYTHQDFPKALYHPDGRVKNANDLKELKKALENGWSETPFEPEESKPEEKFDVVKTQEENEALKAEAEKLRAENEKLKASAKGKRKKNLEAENKE